MTLAENVSECLWMVYSEENVNFCEVKVITGVCNNILKKLTPACDIAL